jgi:hypothetical protein
MKRTLIAAGAGLALFVAAAALAPVAVAGKPVREPSPFPSFTITGSCSFDVRLDVLVNKEFATTFANGKVIVTGRLVLKATNVDQEQQSRVLQISGPGFADLADPAALTLSGTSLVFAPGMMLVTKGPVTATFDEDGNVTIDQTSASSVDVCALLAGP